MAPPGGRGCVHVIVGVFARTLFSAYIPARLPISLIISLSDLFRNILRI